MPTTIEEQTVRESNQLEIELALARTARRLPRPATVETRDDRATPGTISPKRLQLAAANIRHLSALISQLVELQTESEGDDYGALRPSRTAFDAACHLLTDAAIVSAREGQQIPYGCASTDSEGGIRIEWVRPTASVHLVIPASPARDGYIYHEAGDSYGTVASTPEALARWLREIL